MERTFTRKPKWHFDTVADTSHVTFDDGQVTRRNFPWVHYVSARWDYDEPEVIQVEFDGIVILIQGHNLGPLFAAIEDRTLFRVRAEIGFENDRDKEGDTFAIGIRFIQRTSEKSVPDFAGQTELELGTESRGS